MEKLHWRLILVALNLHIVLNFSRFGQVFAQEMIYPKSVLDLAKATACSCDQDCKVGDMEPESICFSACDCRAPRDKKRKAIAKCETAEDCTCPHIPASDRKCPRNSRRQLCKFDDGIFCEYDYKYCVDHHDRFTRPQCECKPGWAGPECDVCVDCNGHASGSNNTAVTALGSLLVVVVLVLALLIVFYWKLGRLPCQSEKPVVDKGQEAGQSPVGNAYSVSGPMPITRQDKPDGDTGEIENEYAYAAINEYATVGSRDKRPAVPTAPVPSVSAAKSGEPSPYYFRLADNPPDQQASSINTTTPANSATTTTKTNTADCYTRVIKKCKPATEEKSNSPISQYDRLDRINFRPPVSGENASPSDNMYGTLASSLAFDHNGSPPM